MKKVISLSMAAVMTVNMAGCGNNQTTQESTVSESAETTAATEAETTAAETSPFEESESEALSWDMAEEILTHISDPEFPDYEVSVLDYGAVPGDGKLDTTAIQSAIDEVSTKGGGKSKHSRRRLRYWSYYFKKQREPLPGGRRYHSKIYQRHYS